MNASAIKPYWKVNLSRESNPKKYLITYPVTVECSSSVNDRYTAKGKAVVRTGCQPD